MDEGARGSATTFVQRGIGDVLISWENEALLVVNGFGRGRFDIVYPPRASAPSRRWRWWTNTPKHGTRAVAEAYLRFLYTPAAQEIAAQHYFRPSWRKSPGGTRTFPAGEMFTVEEVFGSWKQAQKTHFDEGGIFDQIARSRR
jgi:sulfate/thiosulfate transport system substrate-binding protein